MSLFDKMIPPNQGDLSFDQLKEFLSIFEGTSAYTEHLFRLKLRLKNDRISLHRLFLYFHNKKWKKMLEIERHIEEMHSARF